MQTKCRQPEPCLLSGALNSMVFEGIMELPQLSAPVVSRFTQKKPTLQVQPGKRWGLRLPPSPLITSHHPSSWCITSCPASHIQATRASFQPPQHPHLGPFFLPWRSWHLLFPQPGTWVSQS